MKKLLLTLGVAVSITAFAGCGSNSSASDSTTTEAAKEATTTQAAAEKSLDASSISSLCKDLIDGKVFSDELAETSSKIASTQLKLSDKDFSSITCYKSSGATAEEITVIEAKDGADISSAIDSYIAEQKTSFESYLPAEVPKLESAIRETSGNYYILIVAKDTDKAQEILKKYI